MPRVFIPPLMRALTGNHSELEVTGGTLRAVINQLEADYPGTQARLCDGDQLRPGLAVAIDGNLCTQGLRQKLDPNSEVHFLPAIGGG